jgi:predicted negative regulator of RcsB-dependent stress response
MAFTFFFFQISSYNESMQKGFGLISLLFTVAIIGLLVYGGWYYSSDQKKNQIQAEQAAIQKAKDAAQQQTEYNQSLQNEANFDTNANVNYRAVQDKLK